MPKLHLPSPESVRSYDPDLKEFMGKVNGEYSDDLTLAMAKLPRADRETASVALRELSISSGKDAAPIVNELDEGRIAMVHDIHNILTRGELTAVAVTA